MSAHVTVGVSLKNYFNRRRADDWFAITAKLVGQHPAVVSGAVEVFVAPSFLQIHSAVNHFRGTPIAVGAQNVSPYGMGPFTGEVSAAELEEAGVRYGVVGHAERIRLFAEDAQSTAVRTRMLLEAGITPVICVGESRSCGHEAAADAVTGYLRQIIAGAPRGRVVVAYEPLWAIGAPVPAPAQHVASVTERLRCVLAEAGAERSGSAVIYGGAAGPGVLGPLHPHADGVFLGRFAHDLGNFLSVVDEAAETIRRTNVVRSPAGGVRPPSQAS